MAAIIKPPKQNTPFGAAGMAVGALFGSPQAGAAVGNMVGGMVGGGGDVPEVGGSMGRKLGVVSQPQAAPKFEPMEMQPIENPMQRRLLRTPKELEDQLLGG